MVGSRDSISACNVVLNTITAEVFKEACDRLEKAPDFELAVHDLIKEYATDHQKIVFNGNGYAPEWEKEATPRTSDSSEHGRCNPCTYYREGSETL